MKLIKEAAQYNPDDKGFALAQFLKLQEDEFDLIEIDPEDDCYFGYGKKRFYVFTDKEADEHFEEYEKQLIDEMGFEAFSESFKDYIVKKMVDTNKFWKDTEKDVYTWIEDSPESYSSYFNIDKIKENLKKEFKKGEKGLLLHIEKEGYIEIEYEDEKEYEQEVIDYIEELTEDEVFLLLEDTGLMENSYIEEAVKKYVEGFDNIYLFLTDLGYDDEQILEQLQDYVKVQDIIDEIKKQDGRGSALAGYDGEENEEKYNGETYYIYRIV